MPGASLALLSWPGQVSPSHRCCSKALPSERHHLAAVATFTFCTGHYQQEILLPHFSKATPRLWQQVWHRHWPGESTPRRYGPHHEPQTSNKGSRGPSPGQAAVLQALPLRDAQPWSCSPHPGLSGGGAQHHKQLANQWTGSNPNPRAKGCLDPGFGTTEGEAREALTCTVTLSVQLHLTTQIQLLNTAPLAQPLGTPLCFLLGNTRRRGQAASCG